MVLAGCHLSSQLRHTKNHKTQSRTSHLVNQIASSETEFGELRMNAPGAPLGWGMNYLQGQKGQRWGKASVVRTLSSSYRSEGPPTTLQAIMPAIIVFPYYNIPIWRLAIELSRNGVGSKKAILRYHYSTRFSNFLKSGWSLINPQHRRILFAALDILNLNNLLVENFVSLQVEVDDFFFCYFSS